MHDTAYLIGSLIMDTYLPATPAKILEIGAQDVNGTLRDHAPRNAEYIGLDFVAGDGVDIVVTDEKWPVPDENFDLVMASSVFEHDNAFWQTFVAMCRKAKPGGHVYISAPSNGSVHRFPKDYWRFYPDSGLALEEWARSQHVEVTLIESFIAERQAEVWNDFCAVFRCGPSDADLNCDFVHAKVRCTNALTWRSSLVLNPVDDPEDIRLLATAREETQRWVAHSDFLNAETLAQVGRYEEQAKGLIATVNEAQERLAQRDADLAHALSTADAHARERDRIAVLMEKAETDLAEARTKLEQSGSELRRAEEDLSESNFRLDEGRDEIAALGDLLAETQDTLSELEQQNEWLREISRFLLERGRWWWRFMPLAWQRKKRDARLRRRSLFDGEAYAGRYPDVSATRQDPLRHYVFHGIAEHRRRD